MKRILLTGIIAASSLALSAQKLDEQVLFTVDDDTITAGEYMAVYNKNRDLGEDIDPKTPREYLDLYVNFKLKVHEAREMGMDTMPGFKREYYSYREQLAQPYLRDKDVTMDLMKEAYERMQMDVRAAHIMIKADKTATPADTAAAFKKIHSIKDKLENGADFSVLAREYSDDTYSAREGGDLGYFTAFDMVYPFESAAYETPVGEVSEPIRTQYGYHLVKPLDKRDARGVITVSHIMLIANENSSPEEVANAEAKIKELREKLEEGAEFAKLARQHSDDKASARYGGKLKSFGINKMFPEFEEAAFKLSKPGDVTEPVKTPVGYHLIRLESRQERKSFEDSQASLRHLVEEDSRSSQSKVSIVKKLKKEYNFKEYPEVIEEVYDELGDDYLEGKFDMEELDGEYDELLMQFGDRQVNVKEFAQFLKRQGPKKGMSVRSAFEKDYSSFTELVILDYEKSRLNEKYPEFRLLDREYYEGILLFDLTEQKVWRASVKDSAGLYAYFDDHREDYRWKDRYQAVIIDAGSKKLARKAKGMLKDGQSVSKIEAELNENSQLNVSLDSGLYEAGTNATLGMFDEKKEGFSKYKKQNGRYFLVQIQKVIPAEDKSFEEARGRLISDYQEELERRWLVELKDEYPVKVNQEVLEKTIAELEETP